RSSARSRCTSSTAASARCRTACCFFFFQAEDGIRDRNVTGVQTCALPIWWNQEASRPAEVVGAVLDASWFHPGRTGLAHLTTIRSEERRVGKECGSRRAGATAKENATVVTDRAPGEVDDIRGSDETRAEAE